MALRSIQVKYFPMESIRQRNALKKCRQKSVFLKHPNVHGSFTHILHAMFFRPLLIRATIATCHPLKHAELWSIHANPLDVLEGCAQLKV